MLAFFGRVCYHTQAVERRKQNPGVAKFGIALEWGSRGRWFESSHSDHKELESICFSTLYFFVVTNRTSGLLYFNCRTGCRAVAQHPHWFESSHSDQIMGSSFGNFPLFLFCADSSPSKCDMPVAYCCHQFKSWWLPLFSPLMGENEIRIQSLGPYKHDGFDTNHRAFSILVDIYTAI